MKVLIHIGICFIFMFFISAEIFAQCEGDLNRDGDVDGDDVAAFTGNFGVLDCPTVLPCMGDIHPVGAPDGDIDEDDLAVFVVDFGRTDCPVKSPLNLFNIGNSIGEGIAANGIIGSKHHETVWSTGYNRNDTVYTLNERFEDVDPLGYYENIADRDVIFNKAVEGDEMEDFEVQAGKVVEETGEKPPEEPPSATVGMVAVFLGNNDVCTDEVDTMTDLKLFEEQYSAGLEVLAKSEATKNAYIHVVGIPDIYWLWIAKRDSSWCRDWVWPLVPCRQLLEKSAQ